ncbi:methyltransferase [Natronoglycomyces albus]|uniref:Class I SAM-dependent methyltransferase n=1 Tax=Natronoglycomyces albus TaxID=2811108 RepID=A0A895XMA3_9ACTN|nr:class I SAM-dependent methyltransferase [Natronoglycomyces albus]QSB06247.1 class I SAM-dependent methyltransferase [Natronoglycomyces albus]
MLNTDEINQLREAWRLSGYDRYGQISAYGGRALTAASRRDYRELLDLVENDALGVWTTLFTMGLQVPRHEAQAALHPLPLAVALRSGLLVEGSEDVVRAGWGLQFDPANRAVFSDQLPQMSGVRRTDHVLGLGGATKLLGDITLRREVPTALEIGTGCGVHALSLPSHVGRVTATDLNPRALDFARINAGVNEIELELLQGDMFEPVSERQFDLITANPPFVIATPGQGWTYRDAGREGDSLGAELAAAARSKLRPGGVMQFLANWLEIKGERSEDRVAAWFPSEGVRVWAVEREQLDPLDYVRNWQRDSGDQADPHETAQWLNWFSERKVEGIGFGFVTVEAIEGPSDIVCDGVSHTVAYPWSDRIEERLVQRRVLSTMDPETFLEAKLSLADSVSLNQEADQGPDGWEVKRQWLKSLQGLRYADEIDQLMVTLLASCNGQVPLRLQIELLAQTFDGEPGVVYAGLYPEIRRLIDRGYVLVDS